MQVPADLPGAVVEVGVSMDDIGVYSLLFSAFDYGGSGLGRTMYNEGDSTEIPVYNTASNTDIAHVGKRKRTRPTQRSPHTSTNWHGGSSGSVFPGTECGAR
jgi:hypothetical protein